MKIKLILFSITIGLFTNCASIVSKSSYPLSISSEPSESKITITNKKNIEIFSGNTPANIKLRSSNGFFSKAEYSIKFEKNGYKTKTVPITFKLDGWYFGNLAFGGIIGFLIVDPATGAMYKIDEKHMNIALEKDTPLSYQNELKIYSLDQIPKQLKEHLTSIK